MVYRFIRPLHLRSHGRQPTLMEIGALLGMSSSSTVHKHVQKLIMEGRGLYQFDQVVGKLVGEAA